jgi:DNA uptake protein ComE-like DNA-binding protein
MNLKNHPKSWFRQLNTFARQFYTPLELRAIVVFLFLGIAILLYRSGAYLYHTWFPEKRNVRELVERKQQDSLYFALSAIAARRDSLFFSLPEDSLLPPAVLKREQHHSKTDGLRFASISLNHGTKEDFARLPTVGPASAALIIAYRLQRGSFRSLGELMNVHGFSMVRFGKIKRFLCLN